MRLFDLNENFTQPSAAALGFFDGVHLGHASVIGASTEYAKQNGLCSLAVTFHTRPGGGPLLMTFVQRREALEALGLDAACCLDFDSVRDLSPEAFLTGVLRDKLHVKAVFCGFNFRFGKGASADAEKMRALCVALGIRTRVVPPTTAEGSPVSSTRIRALVTVGDIAGANRLLGRSFEIVGEVIHGQQLGRQLGTPTINQKIPDGLVVPRFGVYASSVRLDGKSYPAVTNIGVRPTVDGKSVLCETYIPGYDGDLYGRKLGVSLAAFLRGEEKFSGIDELGRRIRHDARESLRLQSKGNGINP